MVYGFNCGKFYNLITRGASILAEIGKIDFLNSYNLIWVIPTEGSIICVIYLCSPLGYIFLFSRKLYYKGICGGGYPLVYNF